MMSLLLFWALIVVAALRSIQGQKALDFIKNIIIWVPKKMNEGLKVLSQSCQVCDETVISLKIYMAKMNMI